jgi:hypothetical protein
VLSILHISTGVINCTYFTTASPPLSFCIFYIIPQGVDSYLYATPLWRGRGEEEWGQVGSRKHDWSGCGKGRHSTDIVIGQAGGGGSLGLGP